MASTFHVFGCGAAALLFWGIVGFAFSRRLAPRPLAVPLAPALGWAVHSALALPVYRILGFTPWIVAICSVAALGGALWSLRSTPSDSNSGARVPHWAYGLAAVIAVVPAMALLPKIAGGAVTLASPIFDHSKVALIDEMTRLGLPPGNPFFGEAGHEAPLAYYYLWHFSAAELALVFRVSGWEADVALTAFMVFSSLILMMGFATWIGDRVSAGLWVVPLAIAASLYPVLEFVLGENLVYAILQPQTGIAGWLFQTTWAPQHIAAAACVLLSGYLLVQLARRPSALTHIVLILVAVAGYESSVWIGGILFAVASPVMALILLARLPATARMRFVVLSLVAALGAAALAFPFLRDQVVNAAAREGGIAFLLYPVFSERVPEGLRRMLDIPGYWLVLLVIVFPAIYLPGLVSLASRIRSKSAPEPIQQTTLAFAGLMLASLVVVGCLTVTFAENNDLGWRAILPGVFVLTIFAAIGLPRWVAAPTPLAAGGALLLLFLGLPGSFRLIAEDVRGTPTPSDRDFAATPALWDAIRRLSAPAERVANNPRFMEKMTPWPVNISWALLSNRRSCFAGRELALAFTPLPRTRLAEIEDQFRRVFEGRGNLDDVRDLAVRYGCRVVVLTPQDGAWSRDPFAGGGYYTLAAEKAGEWRIYRAAEPGTKPPGS